MPHFLPAHDPDANSVSGASINGNYQSIWGSTLQSNPTMANTVASGTLDQGLLSTPYVMA